MDIYKQAEEVNADYYDNNTGYIYKIQDYNKEKEFNPDARIAVYDTFGCFIGYAKKREDN